MNSTLSPLEPVNQRYLFCRRCSCGCGIAVGRPGGLSLRAAERESRRVTFAS